MAKVRVGIIGLGFIGPAHIEGLRRTGLVDIIAVSDQNEKIGRNIASKYGIENFYHNYQELINNKSVEAVHVCTPNYLHFEMVKAALVGKKHVVCEKPLATKSSEAAELVRTAKLMGLKNCVNFNLRYYPLVQQVRQMVKKGEIGQLFSIHGSYLQDWLLLDTDYNWRLEPRFSGDSRAVADIGSHWMDMIEHISGLKIVEVMADFSTAHKKRKKAVHQDNTTFASDNREVAQYETFDISTEDFASILLRFDNGSKGSLTVSQISAGRKNRLYFEIDASQSSLSFDSENPNELLIGRRGGANGLLMRDPALLDSEASSRTSYPGGHAEGFPDTLKQLYADFYGDILGINKFPHCYASFEDGLRELVLCEKIVESNKTAQWVKV